MTQPGSNFRDESDAISPSWWNGPNGSRIRFSISTPFDALGDSFFESVYAALPSTAPADALPWISQDRQIVQGYQESQASWIARMLQWLERHPQRGKAQGVMLWAIGWILPQLPTVRVVTNSSVWWTYLTGTDPMPAGATTVLPATKFAGSNWNWDGIAAAWFRSWLIIFSGGSSPAWCTGTGTWGDGARWGDSGICWGFDQPSSQVRTLATLTKFAKAGHAYYPWIIVSFNNAEWDPSQPADGTHNPNGTFGRWSKIVGGQYVPARFADSRYISGIP
jgi:hypothetical protein